jgi:hypothetical protein
VQAAEAELKVAETRPASIKLPPVTTPIPSGKTVTFVHCGVAVCDAIAVAIKNAADPGRPPRLAAPGSTRPRRVVPAGTRPLRARLRTWLKSDMIRIQFNNNQFPDAGGTATSATG